MFQHPGSLEAAEPRFGIPATAFEACSTRTATLQVTTQVQHLCVCPAEHWASHSQPASRKAQKAQGELPVPEEGSHLKLLFSCMIYSSSAPRHTCSLRVSLQLPQFPGFMSETGNSICQTSAPCTHGYCGSPGGARWGRDKSQPSFLLNGSMGMLGAARKR